MLRLTPRALVSVALAVGALAGCGDDDDDEGATSTTTTTTDQVAASPIEVTAVDFAYDGLPDEIDAGT